MLKAEDTFKPGQQIEQVSNTEMDLSNSETRKALKEAVIIKPWYKHIAHQVTFFRYIFGRKKYEVTKAKEQTETFRVINGEAEVASSVNTSLP